MIEVTNFFHPNLYFCALMRQLAATIFLFCFLMMTFSRSFTLLNFYINQDAIIAKFCVNKNKPKLHCNGKCFLAKQIKEQEKREAGDAIMELAKIEVISSRSFFTSALEIKTNLIIRTYPNFIVSLPSNYCDGLLKPPRT